MGSGVKGLAVAASLAIVLAVPALGQAAAKPELQLRIQGKLTSNWSIPNSRLYADSCYIESITGGGSETFTFATSRGGVGMDPVYDRGTYLIMLPEGVQQPNTNHFVPGFGAADAVRSGNRAVVWTRAGSWTPDCYAQPSDDVRDNRGCGERHVPWYAEPSDIQNQLIPGPVMFAPLSMTVQCPGPDVVMPDGTGNVYPPAKAHVAASKIRRLVASRHGTLAASGDQGLHFSQSFGLYTVTVTSSVRWKLTLTRVR